MLEHDYAHAIVALQEEGKTDAHIASGLARVLTSCGHERLISRIERALASLQERNAKRSARVLRVSKKEDVHAFEKEIHAVRKALKDEKKYETVVDERIVGGFVIESGTTMYDASYRTALVTLYRAITADR